MEDLINTFQKKTKKENRKLEKTIGDIRYEKAQYTFNHLRSTALLYARHNE